MYYSPNLDAIFGLQNLLNNKLHIHKKLIAFNLIPYHLITLPQDPMIAMLNYLISLPQIKKYTPSPITMMQSIPSNGHPNKKIY